MLKYNQLKRGFGGTGDKWCTVKLLSWTCLRPVAISLLRWPVFGLNTQAIICNPTSTRNKDARVSIVSQMWRLFGAAQNRWTGLSPDVTQCWSVAFITLSQPFHNPSPVVFKRAQRTRFFGIAVTQHSVVGWLPTTRPIDHQKVRISSPEDHTHSLSRAGPPQLYKLTRDKWLNLNHRVCQEIRLDLQVGHLVEHTEGPSKSIRIWNFNGDGVLSAERVWTETWSETVVGGMYDSEIQNMDELSTR